MNWTWLWLCVSLSLAAPITNAQESPFFQLTTIRDSEPGSKFYLNTYGVIETLENGQVFVVWTAAERWPDNYPPFHSGTKGIIYGSFSSDSGKTWTAPRELINSPHNDLDPHLVVNGKSIIVMSTTVPRPLTEWWADTWMTRSGDYGKTWAKQVLMPRWRTYLAGRRHIGLSLKNETLILPSAWDISVEGRRVKKEDSKRIWVAGVLASTDGGKTWAIRGRIADCDGNFCDEGAIVQLKSGDLYMLLRTRGEWLMESRSSDEGRTWTAPVRTVLRAHNSPAALKRLKNGAIIVVWNNSSTNRYPLAVAYSLDETKTWSAAKNIAEYEQSAKEGFQISYPSVTEAPDGTILVTFQRAISRLEGRDLKLARFNFAWLK